MRTPPYAAKIGSDTAREGLRGRFAGNVFACAWQPTAKMSSLSSSQSCRVWVVRPVACKRGTTNNIDGHKNNMEAIVMLYGQPCTVKMRNFSTDSEETMRIIKTASITRPQPARVRLGSWCQSTHSFDGGEFLSMSSSSSPGSPSSSDMLS